MNQDLKSNVIAVLRADSFAQAQWAGDCVLKSGIKSLEVTFTTPEAPKLIEYFRSEFSGASIGAGSLRTEEQSEQARRAGAEFFVSPHYSQVLGDWFLERNLQYIPGGATPSELVNIKERGHCLQKLFPAMVFGPSGVKNILAPLPDLNLIVTGGVNLENAKDYLSAGAKAVCVGGSLFKKKFLLDKDTKALSAEAQKWSDL